jgi:putative ABC transport system permease protein
MVALTWLKGLVAHRRGHLLATAAGVAVGVALLASVGTFLSSTTSKMTERAIGRVPVDWQVQASNGASPGGVLAKVRSQPGVTRGLPVSFAGTTGLGATAGGSTQTTGPGRVLGLPPGYSHAFPGEVRMLSGSPTGALLAQQTAANLHATPGDIVRIGRAAGHGASVRVAGVVDLPAADSLFQQVGAPAGAQPQAPPDNVILLPQRTFDTAMRGAPVTTQVDAAVSHRLPGSPSSAFANVSGAARNLETRLAGAGLVGDNLGSALDKAR